VQSQPCIQLGLSWNVRYTVTFIPLMGSNRLWLDLTSWQAVLIARKLPKAVT
jgi:hypothetical protein